MTFCINTSVNNQRVSIIFDWYGRDEDGGPDWETLEVHALLKTPKPSEASYWVIVNDLLSEDDWVYIETEIYAQWKELERQARDNDF